MSREIDVKALVSHLVRGDGANKCRICMGDTSEGQVFLEDTVMMDGERSVTLADLLELITGIEVADDKELPPGLCRDCSESALAAITFRQACMESHNQWSHAADFLTNIQDPTENDKVYYIFYGAQEKTIIGDQTESAASTEKALCRLNSHFQDPIEVKPKKVERARGRPYNCADCGKKFNVISFLNNHLRNTLKRACNFCGEVVPKVKLAGHLSSEHGKCVFSCGSCHQVFDDTQLLNAHLLNCHGDFKLQCKVCGVCFNSERALSAHAYSHSIFHCSSCEKCYENRKCYIYHQKVCNARRTKANKAVNRFNRYECDHCGSTYTKKPSLRIHIIQKHLNVLPYVCETCGKRTSTISHLRSHELVHKLQRRLFVCHCGAKMRTELGFHLHQRIHSGEKPYECEECGDRFLSASRRSDHIKRRHRSTKDMPHGCEECSARFVRPFELKKHYLSVHSLKFDRPNYRQAQNYWVGID
ncbi:zinc finger protein 492-like isoform X2 [Ostrinia furnacalis]|uniref:zinc finger protein 492-like isoform X2 n=1 Tax=Ostrinia furnacalis TaxID=93504 RepID=UPI00103F185B|nr:zinc finger protein 492-like isoform X2 [Ostrinia furnacalis]